MNACFDLRYPQENEAVGYAIQALLVMTDLVSSEQSRTKPQVNFNNTMTQNKVTQIGKR